MRPMAEAKGRESIMITHFPYDGLGKANYGWLKSSHHFSFANYYNPKRTGFGALLVVNDDWVQAGMGFGAHPHKNMEIISYIRSGALSHEDSTGNKGVVQAGEVQVMSAGSGIVHSEYNHADTALRFYQIWIHSNEKNGPPTWDSKKFPTDISSSELTLLVSGYLQDEGKALFIHQDARIFGGKIKKGSRFSHGLTHQAYILASEGEFEICTTQGINSQGVKLNKGDGAQVTGSDELTITAIEDCEIVLIDAPA
jgi:redox-sensitive bicupin YhaK (pirin superfamily)